MKISFYVIPNSVGLKFDGVAERDAFWNSMRNMTRNGFCAQEAAERVGVRTIRFYPAKMKEGFEWSMGQPNGQVQVTEPPKTATTPVAQSAPPVAVQQSPPQNVVTDNPFGFKTQNPTRPLPGLTPPPPAELLASTQPVAPSPVPAEPQLVAPVDSTTSPTPVAAEPSPTPVTVPASDDPEPPDKRKKEWKQWKARQK